MPFLLLMIGGLLAIAAVRNTHGNLMTALETDVPPYTKWALAIVAVGALGWVPGMQQVSRWLLALVIVVIVLVNYKGLLAGFVALEQTASTTPPITPAVAYVNNPTAPAITPAEIAGSGTTTANAGAAASPTTPPLDPNWWLTWPADPNSAVGRALRGIW